MLPHISSKCRDLMILLQSVMRADRAEGRTSRTTSNDSPVPAGDNAPNQFARGRIDQQRFLRKRLFHFKLTDRARLIGGFVKVGRHKVRMGCQNPDLLCWAISAGVASRTAKAIMWLRREFSKRPVTYNPVV